MEKEVKKMQELVANIPPVEWENHKQSHLLYNDLFILISNIVDSIIKTPDKDVILLKKRLDWINNQLSKKQVWFDSILSKVEHNAKHIQKIFKEIVSNKYQKQNPFQILWIAVNSWKVLHFSKFWFTYSINELKFYNSNNHYFSYKKIDWYYTLTLNFDKITPKNKLSNVKYDLFINQD